MGGREQSVIGFHGQISFALHFFKKLISSSGLLLYISDKATICGTDWEGGENEAD